MSASQSSEGQFTAVMGAGRGAERAPAPIAVLAPGIPWSEVDLATHALTGWPHAGECQRCGARAIQISSTFEDALYECRGTPDPAAHSAYGADRCGAVFTVRRVPAGAPRSS